MKIEGGFPMRRLKTMSMDELLDREVELRASRDVEQASSMNEAISVYEELYRRINPDKGSEYIQSLDTIREQLVLRLIRYGTYLKTEYQKDDRAAKRTLTKALNYDRTNPLARYRLGFIAYKESDYMESLLQFQQALHAEEREKYKLSSQQRYNAGLYLSNSALYIAQQAQASLETVEGDISKTGISSLELSPLYEIITKNETYLLNHAFSMTSQEGVKRCSKDDCEDLIDSDQSGTLILYFSDRNHAVFYKGKELQRLSINQAKMLRTFMLESNEERSATKYEFEDLFEMKVAGGEITDNTYITAVKRLREKLADDLIPTPIIVSKRYRNETGYYYNQTLPYLVIERADDV